MKRTIKLVDTVLVLEHVRGLRLERAYGYASLPENERDATLVWCADMSDAFCVEGNHVDTLQAAIDGITDNRLVIVESPYAGEIVTNVRYARAAVRDCFLRGEYPIASHLLYTQVGILDDHDKAERALGIEAGLAWGKAASRSVVYTDRGITDGMKLGIERATLEGRVVEMRTVPGWV
jgi:hypothetical protein